MIYSKVLAELAQRGEEWAMDFIEKCLALYWAKMEWDWINLYL